MRRFILGVVWVAVAGVAAADEPKADKPAVAKALDTFAGTWEVVAVQPDGATKGARRLVFHKDGRHLRRPGQGREGTVGGDVRDRPDRQPEGGGPQVP